MPGNMVEGGIPVDGNPPAASKLRNRQSGKSKAKVKDLEKCDGNTPSCAACLSVYHTECVYDPNSDHRRKGVYKQDIDNLRNRNNTLQTLVEAILNYDEDDVMDLVRQMRSSDDLETVAESIIKGQSKQEAQQLQILQREEIVQNTNVPQFESQLAGRMSELRLDGTVKYIGGTSNLIFLPPDSNLDDSDSCLTTSTGSETLEDTITCWTTVTKSKELVCHLLTMYFTWHYPYFTVLSKRLFYRDYVRGRPSQYCSPLLVSAMLALGCHFSTWPASRENPADSATAGDHFFREAKRLILENDEYEKAKLCNVQAFAIMSVREAGCGREGSGWVYSGMSFRMAYDLGLNVDATGIGSNRLSDEDIDARRITFWGCYLFDKCWSNYLGRQPQLAGAQITVPKVDVFPDEDAETWSPYTDAGVSPDHTQPARTRAVALQISNLCEISSDLLSSFYNPVPVTRPMGKQEELRRLSQLHTRLEAWRKDLPKELEPKDGQLPQALLMHMFFQLLFIHLYRPFLKYTKSTSPLPQHVSPRKLCTQSASMISKLLRIYKRTYGLRQICNVAIYIVHSACTIHLLNLPDKGAKRDIISGLKNLEEMSESWPCARRTLRILDISAQKWRVDLPAEASTILERCHVKFGSWGSWDQGQSPSTSDESVKMASFEAASVTSTRGSTPEDTPASVRPIASPLEISVPNVTTNSQLAPPFYPGGQSSTTGPAKTVGREYYAPSLPPTLPVAPSQDLDMDIQPKSETDDSQGIIPIPEITSVSVDPPQVPAFTGMENLVEESQDWWFKDQNALALGLDNWDWGSQESASGDIDAERKIRHTSSPAPAYGEGAHIMPGQPIGAINPSFFLHAQSYRGNYSTTGTTSESNNVLQPFNASPLQDGNDAQGPMYY